MSNFSKSESKMLCAKFANKIFDKADAVDRAGMANKSTAKTFYAAASFLDMLKQFDDGSDDEATEEDKKSFYAKWKATEILKAIKEGREPTPGGYGEDNFDTNDDVDEAEHLPAYSEIEYSEPKDMDIPPVPDAPPLPPPTPPESDPKTSPEPESTSESIANFVGSFFGKTKSKVSKDNLNDAKELTRFALKALDAKDTNLAAERLKQALSCLVEEES